MALASGSLFEMRADATTGNVNGSGFNTGNANFLADGTVDSNTGNTAAPVFSSATYNFVAGDVGAYLYVKAGTNTIPGMYAIVSVDSNKATLNATAGQTEVLSASTGMWELGTATGIATVGTPTSITFGVDYSRLATAKVNAVADFSSVGASTTMTSATAGFTPVMVGNFYHQTTTGTGAFGVVGWYEIVSYTNATTVVLDRTPNNGTASVNCTGYVGGAGILNALEDTFYEMVPVAAKIFYKGSGTHTISGAISIVSTNATAANPVWSIGYSSYRGQAATGTTRPIIAGAANGVVWGVYQNFINMTFTTTTAAGISPRLGAVMANCKVLNSSSTANRAAIGCSSSSGDNLFFNCEAVSQNGPAFAANSEKIRMIGCYAHDSNIGFEESGGTTSGGTVINCISEGNTTAAYTSTSNNPGSIIVGNTFYGREAKIGTGINLNTTVSTRNRIFNNIIYGFVTGVNVLTNQQNSNYGAYNNFYNNTTDAALYNKDKTDLALDPQFAGATQITGTTATTSGSVLTQSGGDFSTVEDNIDYLHVISGTGVTVGVYLITSHTGTTLTVNNALGTSGAGNVVYFIPTGHNFAIGTNLKSRGFPGAFNTDASSAQTTGYMDVGAVQRQEPTLASTFLGG